MTLCSAASSKLDTILSPHIRVCMIKHLFEIVLSAMQCILSRMLISLRRLLHRLAFPRSVPHARVGIGDALKSLT